MDLRYPIGKFEPVSSLTPEQRSRCRTTIAETPARLRAAVQGLSDEQLDTPYRPDGWTVRQVVHHVPDSHLNAYIRMKLGVTEDRPVIKTYDQDLWSNLSDGKSGSIDVSLDLLEALHERWDRFIGSLAADDYARKLTHPEWHEITIDFCLAQYAWHGAHHVAHVTSLRERKGW